MKDFTKLATDEQILQTKASLEKNGFQVIVAEDRKEAKGIILELIPKGSEVMANTSKTLDEIGVREEIDNSGNYKSLHKLALSMDREKENDKILQIRSAPHLAMGSFHAVTLDGKIMMASGSGSQIPGYSYGAKRVIFVAGTQKIVKNLDEGFERIYQHSLPLESERINKVYNTTDGSNPRRILIINSESDKNRTTVVLVKELLGF